MEQFLRKFLADMPCFVEVADAASFTRAAERLGIPLATLSRRITALEQHLGTRLFFRGARSLTLTEDGRELLESARLMLAEAEGARQRLMLRHGEPFGPIRVSMEAAVFHCFLHGALGSFAARYPGVDLKLVFSDAWKDLHHEPFDLDIRSGPVPYRHLKVRKLLSVVPALYCAPALLENFPRPEAPEDLTRLPWIAPAAESRSLLSFSRNGRLLNVTLRPKHAVQSIDLTMELVLLGQGVTMLMPCMACRLEREGRLIRLLPDWTLAPANVHLALPGDKPPGRVRLFVDHLAEHCRGLQV